MARYLVEVSQQQALAAKRMERSVNMLGSHFATHADWRHKDGMSSATMIVEADDRWGALGIVPPALRPDARVSRLDTVAGEARLSRPSVDAAHPGAIAA